MARPRRDRDVSKGRLFILYINDICELMPDGVIVKLFADDTKLFRTTPVCQFNIRC